MKRILAVLVLAFAVSSPADAAEQHALPISSNIQARHMPHGTIIDPKFDTPTGTITIRYTRAGDSALWTGHYLAAEAFRYSTTSSPEALANLWRALRGIRSLVDVTGTNLLARCLVPVDWESDVDKNGIIIEEAHHGVYTGNVGGRSYYWIGNTSRDQYSGIFFGLSVAYDLIDEARDPAVRPFVRESVTLLLEFLLRNNWSVVMPNGSISTVFLGRFEQQLSFLQVGRQVNPGRFDATYQSYRANYSSSVGAAIVFDTLDEHRSYFKFNLDYINLYNLIHLEEVSSPYLGAYFGAYRRLREVTRSHGNAHFNLIDRALTGPNSVRDAETLSLLDEWLLRPGRDAWVDLRCCASACGDDRACAPIPLRDRVRTDFLWQRSPFLLYGGGDGTIETSGIDYILPYWMSRYYEASASRSIQSGRPPIRRAARNF